MSSAQLQESVVWQEIDSLLAGLNPDQDVATLMPLCAALEAKIRTRSLSSGRRKGEVLRALFRLLDLKETRLLLRVVRIMLLITKTGPTIANACKLLFKLSRDSSNDQFFADEGINEVLVSLLETSDRHRNTEALVYCCGTIKNITNGAALQTKLVDSGAVQALAAILTDIAADLPAAGTDLCRNTDNLLLQATAALRNLSVQGDHRQVFLSSNLVALLAGLLISHAESHALMLNVSRIFSKLTLHSDCRAALSAVPAAIPRMHSICIRHRSHRPLVVRFLFTLGNLTATDPRNRHILFQASSSGESLLQLLEHFALDLLPSDGSIGSHGDAAGKTGGQGNGGIDSQGLQESENALVKLVRVVANLCIDPSIGASFCVAGGCTTACPAPVDPCGLTPAHLYAS